MAAKIRVVSNCMYPDICTQANTVLCFKTKMIVIFWCISNNLPPTKEEVYAIARDVCLSVC